MNCALSDWYQTASHFPPNEEERMFITHCILHIVYPVDADWAIYEICFLQCRAMIGLCWIDACVDASKQKLSEALFSLLYSACCEYNIRPIQMVHDDRCKTPLHHVRKQERLEQMKLVLQKQLGRPTRNSWDAPLKTKRLTNRRCLCLHYTAETLLLTGSTKNYIWR